MSAEADLGPQRRQDNAKHGKRLTEAQKRAVIAAVASGETRIDVATRFGLNRNTVSDLCKSIEHIDGSDLSTGWRSRLGDELCADSVNAIKASITDRLDVHKAASTATAHLKGVGVYASEANTQVSVLVQGVAGLPKDWQESYFAASVTPGNPPTSSGLASNGDIIETEDG